MDAPMIRTLIVEDELLARAGLHSLVEWEKLGFVLLEDAKDGQEALDRIHQYHPDLLLLDEPFSALDYQTRLSVCDDISTIIKSAGKTAILITHDLSEAISVADRVVILSSRPGKVKSIIPVSFPDDCARPLERRNSPEFSIYFNKIWKDLQE